MMKKIVVIFAVLGLMFQTSCTSKDSKQEADATVDYDSAEMAALEGADSASGDDGLMSAELPEEALGEVTPEEKPSEVVTTETTTTTEELSPLDSSAAVENTETTTLSEMSPAEPSAEILPPMEPTQEKPLEEPAMAAISEPMPTETAPAEPKPATASLQKVKTSPYREGNLLVNGIYFARPGDSLASISQNIYGTDKTGDLKKINPSLKKRDVRPGDKVYYSSPNRPDDATRMLTWYEENGIAPEVYVAKSGDNIRSVSKKLLGYSDAWKEVWSSNDLESKGKMDEGTQIRYWASAPAPAPQINEIAKAPAQPEQQAMEQQTPPEMPAFPEPPAMDVAANELPPPPAPDDMMAGNELPPPPPPPPPVSDQMAPPPPPPPPAPEMAQEADEAPGMDEDMTLALTAVMIAAAGMAALIVVRKKRKQKEADQSLNTHVG